MRLPFILFLLPSIVAACGCAQTTPTMVDLGYAKYEGSVNPETGNVEFLGMRFAASPTGSRRWREPQRPEYTPGVQQANAFPNRCFQAVQGTQPRSPFSLDGLKPGGEGAHHKRDVPAASEDCLFLNVVTPGSVPGKKKLPVVVWIHGGGYMFGGASGFFGADIYDGNDLIREAGGGVVAVIIQYRLGVFGFLAGEKVHRNGALNAGLLDQQFALKWVQEHISKFNGDPDKVTIWGESAGAGSAIQHIIANGGHTHPPLFRAAISSSSFIPSQYRYNDRIPEAIYSEVVNATGCAKARDTFQCLKGVDAGLLEQANSNIGLNDFFGVFTFVPVIDGHLITDRPTKLLRSGRLNGQAVLAVTNTFEGVIFVDQTAANTVQTQTYVANLFPELHPSNVAAAVARYANQGTPISQANAIMGESIFICPTYYLLRAFRGRSFKGEYAVPPGIHANDVGYYFPSAVPGGNGIVSIPFNNTQFINNFAQSFLNFAMTLDPNVKWDSANTLPKWAKWSEGGKGEMLFNKTESNDPVFRSITTSRDLLERCDFWESASALTSQ